MTEARPTAQAGRAIILFGTAQAPPERVELHAGPLSMTLENGALRWLTLDGIEVLRGIAFLVRDRNWGTPSPEIVDLDLRRTDGGFRLTLNAICRTDDGELPWSAEITGAADGRVRFVGTAKPKNDFVTNRTGFVILHPLERVAGCPVDVTHTDGTTRRARFPALIDPEPCFFDIRALAHEAVPGVWATCTMAGDAWEMEDHRNWLDASFKTYVRPLALPHPYAIAGGSTVEQTLTLTFKGVMPQPRKATTAAPVEIALGRSGSTHMPLIGLRASLPWMKEANAAIDLLRPVRPQLVNGRIDPRAGQGETEIRQFGALASALGAGLMLEYVVPCRRDPEAELAEFAGQLRASGVRPESVAVALAEDRIRQEPGAPPPPLALMGEVYRAARAVLPGVTIGGGTFAFFTELNRNWPPIGLIDYITHMVSSVVHASDDRSMMENLESFQHIAATVRAFAGALPHRVVAAGIGLESGAGGDPVANPNNERVAMARLDPRHRGLFGAAWALASIGAMAQGGVATVTPAALAGEFGLVQAGNALFPIYHVIAGMAEAARQELLESTPSDVTRVAAVAHRKMDGGSCLWLANLRDTPQKVLVPDLGGDTRLACLDEASFAAAATDTTILRKQAKPLVRQEIEIGAYGVVRIESGR